MADLDDFFAKKDKKKSKGKKFATADEIAKKLEETGKKSDKLKKEKTLQNSSGQDGEENGTIIQVCAIKIVTLQHWSLSLGYLTQVLFQQ